MNRPLSTSGPALAAAHPRTTTPGDARALVVHWPAAGRDVAQRDTSRDVLSGKQRRHLLWGLVLAVTLIAVAGWSVVSSSHLPVSPPMSVMHDDAPGALPLSPPPHRP